jgi:hypothetical protein
MKRWTAIANFAYAGTNKYVTHAINEETDKTFCGMDIQELMSRQTGEWEIIDGKGGQYNTEMIIIGCMRCCMKPQPA